MKKSIFLLLFIALSNIIFAQDIQDYISGPKARYNSKGNPKSLGINIVLDYPKSWSIVEGKRPHILNRIVMPTQNGNSAILIVQVILLETSEDKNAISDAISNPLLFKDMLPEDEKYVSGNNIIIDHLKAAIVTTTLSRSTELITVHSKNKTYNLIYDDKWIRIGCSVSSQSSVQTDELFESFKYVFALIGNSIMIENQWTN